MVAKLVNGLSLAGVAEERLSCVFKCKAGGGCVGKMFSENRFPYFMTSNTVGLYRNRIPRKWGASQHLVA